VTKTINVGIFLKIHVTIESSIFKLEEKFGREKLERSLDEFNTAGRIEALTEKEGRFILRQLSINSLRDRILADAQEANITPTAWQKQASLSRLAEGEFDFLEQCGYLQSKIMVLSQQMEVLTMSSTLDRAMQAGRYGKSIKMIQHLAMLHWMEWRPKESAQLKATNYWLTETLKAARKAHKGIRELREAGYQNHEAEEVMLKRYILLPPEKEVIEEMEREE
jgi:hypothetical protein